MYLKNKNKYKSQESKTHTNKGILFIYSILLAASYKTLQFYKYCPKDSFLLISKGV